MGMPVRPLLARGIKAKLTPGFDYLRKKICDYSRSQAEGV